MTKVSFRREDKVKHLKMGKIGRVTRLSRSKDPEETEYYVWVYYYALGGRPKKCYPKDLEVVRKAHSYYGEEENAPLQTEWTV